MDQRLSMMLVGVESLNRSRRFYEEGLGWTPWGAPRAGTGSVKYMAGGVLITLIDRGYVAKEGGLVQGLGCGGLVLVINVNEREEVDRTAAEVIAAGGAVTSTARERDGGIYSFYFGDPDGNAWEVVWNPRMPMDSNGVLQLPN